MSESSYRASISNTYRASVIQRMGSLLCDGGVLVLNGVDHAGEISDESSGKLWVHDSGRGAGSSRFWRWSLTGAISRVLDFWHIARFVNGVFVYACNPVSITSRRRPVNIFVCMVIAVTICTKQIVLTFIVSIIIVYTTIRASLAPLIDFCQIGSTSAKPKSHGKGGRKN